MTWSNPSSGVEIRTLPQLVYVRPGSMTILVDYIRETGTPTTVADGLTGDGLNQEIYRRQQERSR